MICTAEPTAGPVHGAHDGCSLVKTQLKVFWAVPNGYPNPTRYPVFSSIPDPTRFNFENHRVAGNPKYRVLPDISGNTRSFGYYPKFSDLDLQIICELPGITRKYPEYPELPESKKDTRKYPIVFSTLLPDPNPTRYPVFFPIPDPTRY